VGCGALFIGRRRCKALGHRQSPEKWSSTPSVMEWGGEAIGWHRFLKGRVQDDYSASIFHGRERKGGYGAPSWVENEKRKDGL
jgi:hypothetical protein